MKTYISNRMVTKWNSLFWGPFILGMWISLFAILSPASRMSIWRVRQFAVDSIFCILLLQLVVVMLCCVLRWWRKAFLSTFLLGVLFMLFFISVLFVGPSIDSIVRKVTAATNCSSSQLACQGGSICRESVVVFKVDESVSLDSEFVAVKNVGVWAIRIRAVMKWLNIRDSMNESDGLSVFEKQLGFDKLLAVRGKYCWYLLFYGNEGP